MKKLLLAFGLATSFVIPASSDPHVEIIGDGFDNETVQRAVSEFLKVCSPLNEHLDDVPIIRAEIGVEYAEYRLANGWKKSFHIAIPLSERLRSLPETDERIGVIAGHTLHYYIGGGSRPGMFGSKRVSQLLCGMPISDSGDDVFASVPTFAFISY